MTSGPYHLVRHPIYSGILVAGSRHRSGAELAVADRRGTGRVLLPLQRDRRGALLGRATPRHLPRVQAATKMLFPYIF